MFLVRDLVFFFRGSRTFIGDDFRYPKHFRDEAPPNWSQGGFQKHHQISVEILSVVEVGVWCPPPKTFMEPKHVGGWKMFFLFQGVIFRFHVKFRWSKEFSIGCTNRTVRGVSCDVQKKCLFWHRFWEEWQFVVFFFQQKNSMKHVIYDLD